MTFNMKIRSQLIRTYFRINSSLVNRRCFHEKILAADLPVVSETGIKNQLNEYSIPFKEGYTCLQVKDCLCGQTFPKFMNSGDIFINKRTGFFLCEKCKATGDWASYSSLLSAKVKNEKVDVEMYKQYWERYDKDLADWKDVILGTESLQNFTEADHTNIFREFNLPLCSRIVSEKLKIRINKERDLLFFPLECVHPPVVGYKTYDKSGKEATFPRGNCPGFLLFSSSAKSSAVVVANINDFLTLISQKIYDYDIICLQYGTSYLPQSTLPFFEKYNRIVLWLGEGSLDTTANIATKLNEKRCYIVRPTEKQTSVSVALSRKQNITEILSKAKLAWHQYVTTFSSLREEILAELQNNYQTAGVPWKRFPALTKILKGHRRGELTILTGPTGVGKTTFLSEYSLDLATQGVNTLWGSFELKNTRLAKILLTQFAESTLSDEDIHEFNAVCDRFEELPFFFLTFHGQQELSNVMDAIKHCSYTYDIAHVVIDNVQFMIEVAPDVNQLDRFWKQDFMIQSFRSFASQYNCHVTLVMHPKKVEGMDLSVNSIFGGAKASQEADNVLIIQKKDLNNFGVKKYLQVCKNRYSGDLGLFPLYFDKHSLSFSKPINFSKFPTKQNDLCVSQSEPWNEEEEEEEEEQLEEEIDDSHLQAQ